MIACKQHYQVQKQVFHTGSGAWGMRNNLHGARAQEVNMKDCSICLISAEECEAGASCPADTRFGGFFGIPEEYDIESVNAEE